MPKTTKIEGLPEKDFSGLIARLRADKRKALKNALLYAKPLAKCSPVQVKAFIREAKGWLTRQHILRLRQHGIGKMSARLARLTSFPLGVDRFKKLSKADQGKLNNGHTIPVYTPDGTRNQTVEEMTKQEVARVFNSVGGIRKPDEQARIVQHDQKIKNNGSPIVDIEVVRGRVVITAQDKNKSSMSIKRFGQKLKSAGVLEKLGIEPVSV